MAAEKPVSKKSIIRARLCSLIVCQRQRGFKLCQKKDFGAISPCFLVLFSSSLQKVFLMICFFTSKNRKKNIFFIFLKIGSKRWWPNHDIEIFAHWASLPQLLKRINGEIRGKKWVWVNLWNSLRFWKKIPPYFTNNCWVFAFMSYSDASVEDTKGVEDSSFHLLQKMNKNHKDIANREHMIPAHQGKKKTSLAFKSWQT